MRDMDENGVFSLRGGRAHTISVENRERTVVTGVMDVESFNEEEIICVTEGGTLAFVGQGLHISKLDLSEGQLVVEGFLLGANYLQERPGKSGMFSKLFR